jgi:hypothetical protein
LLKFGLHKKSRSNGEIKSDLLVVSVLPTIEVPESTQTPTGAPSLQNQKANGYRLHYAVRFGIRGAWTQEALPIIICNTTIFWSNHNISPEKLGKEDTDDGLIPQTLRPLVEKRLALKKHLLELDPRDCQVQELKQRSAALKWLLVVCFGYLGYKNAHCASHVCGQSICSKGWAA